MKIFIGCRYFLLCAGFRGNSEREGIVFSFSGCTPTRVSPSSASSGRDNVCIKDPLKALYGEIRHAAIATNFHIIQLFCTDQNCKYN
ncbi:hypothetical protein XELAEV_18012716mg [Xenopus laevis]|uniref:Uncharacterized protein n=1 Tax=Xenopus laevis TaxID=8355 RepID=A0A974DQE2_XENLA|nr:hypothetical protein XELAEV_18012716mg [Xenopus laevis]